MKLRSLALLILLLPASLMAAQTTVVGISSYGDNNTWNGFAMAQSFTTDSNSYSNLNFVLQLANSAATNQGSFSVGLYSGTTTSMGTIIGSLNTTNTSFFTNPSGSDFNFQSINFGNNALILEANTTYWVGISNPDNAFNWESVYDPVTTGVGTYGNGFSENTTISSGSPLNMTVTGTVPEPSTYALMGLGALALVVAYRRKRTA
jgi:hypothetical protein